MRLEADAIALGHTRDDQAETFLLRLLRGAGSRGLAGMHPRRGHIVRPLLDCRRGDLRSFLEERGEPFVHDESNDDVSIPRNRVRAELLPLLERRFNPSVVDVLADEAMLAREEWDWIQQAAREAGPAVVSRPDPFVWLLDVPALERLPAAVARATVREALDAGRGGAARVVPACRGCRAALAARRRSRRRSRSAPGTSGCVARLNKQGRGTGTGWPRGEPFQIFAVYSR